MTTRARARRALAAALIVLLPAAVFGSGGAARAATRRTTTATTNHTPQPATVAVAPGETAPNGGPLLVPGDVSSSEGPADETSNDNTGTVVALVIAGLLVVALLLALLTYWFWRNTRPTKLEGSKSESESTPEAPTPATQE